mmetsp:Transcript_45718/g.116970  ORF Transcript_45718/g.116970 Transcript_45718/m.116970 type:complete len:356 (-) Transcript_45718:158-1225(-)
MQNSQDKDGRTATMPTNLRLQMPQSTQSEHSLDNKLFNTISYPACRQQPIQPPAQRIGRSALQPVPRRCMHSGRRRLVGVAQRRQCVVQLPQHAAHQLGACRVRVRVKLAVQRAGLPKHAGRVHGGVHEGQRHHRVLLQRLVPRHEPRMRLRHAGQALQHADGGALRAAVLGLPLALVVAQQRCLRLWADDRVEFGLHPRHVLPQHLHAPPMSLIAAAERGASRRGGALHAVRRQDVARHGGVPLGVILIKQDQHKVKSAEQWGGKPGVDRERLVGIVGLLGIHDAKDGGGGAQRGDEAGLGNAERLLLHGLQDGSAVALLDAVKLVDAAHPAVREHQRPGLQTPLASLLDSRGR